MAIVTKSSLRVELPVVLTRDTIYRLVEALFKRLRPSVGVLVFDFTKLKEIQVGGVTVLCNLMAMCRQMGIAIRLHGAEWCEAAEFLERSGLIAFAATDKEAPGVCPTFLPIKAVQYDRSHSYMNDELIPWLSSNFGQQPRALSTLRVCFEEVFNNIRDHSTRDVGCSAGHFDRVSGKATICVSDFGIGIPGRVRSAMQLGSDHAAIAMACQEGFTTRTTPRNMGAGLHVLVRNVVERNKGTLIITSGEGMYSCYPATGAAPSKRTGKPAGSKFPGTMIHITLQESDFSPDEVDEEEFQWE